MIFSKQIAVQAPAMCKDTNDQSPPQGGTLWKHQPRLWRE